MDFLLPLTITAILLFLLSFISNKINFFSIPLFILGGILARSLLIGGVEIISILARLGLLLLLFYIGFEISPVRYLKNLKNVLTDGSTDLVISLILPLLIFLLITGDFRLSLFLSAMLYISSSAIDLKIIIDSRFAIYSFAEKAINILLFQDIIIAFLIIILPVFFIEFRSETIFFAFANIFIFTIYLTTIYLLLKYLRDFINRSADDTIIILSFAVLLLSAYISERLINSEVMGAFMAGSIIKATGFRIDLKRSFASIKDIFSPFFFFYSGLQIYFEFSKNIMILIIVSILISILSKYLISYMLYPKLQKDSIFRNILFGLLTIRGEFSIVLASISFQYLNENARSIVMIISTFIIIFNMIIGLIFIRTNQDRLIRNL